MVVDEEGFKYPQVDDEVCIECGLCEKTCPVINQAESCKPIKVYAAKNNNEEIRLKSSSGGVFTLLAESIIKDGGVVFGVRFDSDWNAVHDYTESVEGLEVFRGSKYVQSDISDNFKKAKEFLKKGRKVLFSGTPCQIAGLKEFLRNDYDNLLTVDVVCHGVPSPAVWIAYIKSIARVSVHGKNSVLPSIRPTNGRTKIRFCRLRNTWFTIRQSCRIYICEDFCRIYICVRVVIAVVFVAFVPAVISLLQIYGVSRELRLFMMMIKVCALFWINQVNLIYQIIYLV